MSVHGDRCVTCNRCLCDPCREKDRAGKWFAPPSGGYHGCLTAEQKAKGPGVPPKGPAGSSTGHRAPAPTWNQPWRMWVEHAVTCEPECDGSDAFCQCQAIGGACWHHR